ncbi:hypothetical protein [Paraburkholderia tagetis]|nr:hypothetical protein [Paraburkholderia tagetis]
MKKPVTQVTGFLFGGKYRKAGDWALGRLNASVAIVIIWAKALYMRPQG